MDGSPSLLAGELHLRFGNCRRHPLILDGSDIAPPARHRDELDFAPTTRSVCACTFYLVFKEPACGPPPGCDQRRLRTPPVRFISFRGTFLSYRPFTGLSTPSTGHRIFFQPSRAAAIAPDELAKRAVAVGNGRPEGVSAGKCRRRVTLGPLNIRGARGPVNPWVAGSRVRGLPSSAVRGLAGGRQAVSEL
jgi:hypothetical protein